MFSGQGGQHGLADKVTGLADIQGHLPALLQHPVQLDPASFEQKEVVGRLAPGKDGRPGAKLAASGRPRHKFALFRGQIVEDP